MQISAALTSGFINQWFHFGADMTKYLLNMTKTTKYMSKTSRNVIFSKSKNPTPRITQDWGGGGSIGVLLIALLIANALTQPPYSTPLLKGVTQGLRGMSLNKLLYPNPAAEDNCLHFSILDRKTKFS